MFGAGYPLAKGALLLRHLVLMEAFDELAEVQIGLPRSHLLQTLQRNRFWSNFARDEKRFWYKVCLNFIFRFSIFHKICFNNWMFKCSFNKYLCTFKICLLCKLEGAVPFLIGLILKLIWVTESIKNELKEVSRFFIIAIIQKVGTMPIEEKIALISPCDGTSYTTQHTFGKSK